MARLPSDKFSIEDVWGAAVAAQRINGDYVKFQEYNSETSTYEGPRRNRDVMRDLLYKPEDITDQDRQQGREILAYLQGDITFRALKGRLTEFDQAISRCLAVTDQFDSVQHRYELAVIASLPNAAKRSQARADQDSRMRFAAGGTIGKVGDKIMANLEVVSCSWSSNFGVYWVRGITDQDQAVEFSLKTAYDAGTWLTIRGTVKGYRDNITRLNRVRVL